MRQLKRQLLYVTLILFVSVSSVFAQNAFDTYFKKGKLNYERAYYPDAIKYFNRALKEDPNSAEVYYQLGLIYRDKGSKLNTTAWYFKVALDIKPKFLEAREALGGVYSKASHYDLAIEQYLKVLEINSRQLSAHFALAWIYLNGKGEPNEAIYHFKKVIERGEIPEAYLGMGIAYSRLEDRPMVLDTVTMLRDKGFDEFASQLEAIIRKEDELKNPPSIPNFQGQIPSSQAYQTQAPTQVQESSGGGQMRVRLRGQLYNMPSNDEEDSESKEPTPMTYPNVLQSK